MICPLCLNNKTDDLAVHPKGHQFFSCSKCKLLFKHNSHWPNWVEQKKIYDQHENIVEDKRYQNYLTKTLNPLLDFISDQMVGLDFGCGPSKGAETLLGQKGFICSSYDAIYFDDKKLLTNKYDFIIANEVVEHFQSPEKEFQRIYNMLKSGGILALRTELAPKSIENWWYLNDPTHIVFYCQETLNFIAEIFNLSIVFQLGPVSLFRRN